MRYLGGPWPTHREDAAEPNAPYHLTAEEARRNATPAEATDLRERLERLAWVVQVPQQDLSALLKARGRDDLREGVVPPASVAEGWPAEDRARFAELSARIAAGERELESRVRPWVVGFAAKAWRRPVADAEADRLMRLYRAAGDSFDTAVKAPLLMVLAAPQFLYRLPDSVAAAPGAATRPLTGRELAVRLWFFLWGSLPDEPLLAAAASGWLTDPAGLAAEARRMLCDGRAGHLARSLGGQLFRFTDFESFTGPDPKRFREFTPELRQATRWVSHWRASTPSAGPAPATAPGRNWPPSRPPMTG